MLVLFDILRQKYKGKVQTSYELYNTSTKKIRKFSEDDILKYCVKEGSCRVEGLHLVRDSKGVKLEPNIKGIRRLVRCTGDLVFVEVVIGNSKALNVYNNRNFNCIFEFIFPYNTINTEMVNISNIATRTVFLSNCHIVTFSNCRNFGIEIALLERDGYLVMVYKDNSIVNLNNCSLSIEKSSSGFKINRVLTRG